MYFDPQFDDLDTLEGIAEISVASALHFLQFDSEDIEFRFFPDLSAFDNYVSSAGGTPGEFPATSEFGCVACLSPHIFSSFCDDPIYNRVIYETSKLYILDSFSLDSPAWLVEGVSAYIADISREARGRCPSFKNMQDHVSEDSKPFAFSFMRYVIDEFGWDVLLNYMVDLRDTRSFKHASRKFADSYGLKFRQVKQCWLKDYSTVGNFS